MFSGHPRRRIRSERSGDFGLISLIYSAFSVVDGRRLELPTSALRRPEEHHFSESA
jgi:hypothetical protein